MQNNKSVESDKQKGLKSSKSVGLKKRIIIPLALVLVAMLGVFYWARNRGVPKDITRKYESAQKLFKKQLDSDTEILNATIKTLIESGDPQIQATWIARDHEKLLNLTSPLFEQLRSKHRITHFYFHDTDRINFLRVHNPKRHSDLINRFTMLGAEKTGQPFAGIELGPLGTFSLRSVHPWLIKNQLVSYIEMGEEIDHVIEKLHKILNVEIFIAIEKSFRRKSFS